MVVYYLQSQMYWSSVWSNQVGGTIILQGHPASQNMHVTKHSSTDYGHGAISPQMSERGYRNAFIPINSKLMVEFYSCS